MKIKLTFWKVVFLALMAAGFYSTVVRFAQGLGRSTNEEGDQLEEMCELREV